MKEVSDIEKNQHIGRYMLPGHLLDENSREDPVVLEDKDKMGKNMRDFVIMMGCQDVVKNAKRQTSYKVEDVRKRN